MIDFNRMAQNLGLEESEFVELVELFIDTSNADIKKLETALETDDIDSTSQAAHSLKGASASLGLREISETALKMEKRAKKGSLDGVAESIRKIRKNIEELKRRIGP